MAIDPDGLLRHARALVPTQRGRPSDADLRRGVSAAYYAVFHSVTELVASHLIGSASADDRARLRRTWGHSEIDSACFLIVQRSKTVAAKPSAPPTKDQAAWGPLVDLAARDNEIAEASKLFRELQQHRHAADYDHLATFDKARLLSAVRDAQDARDHLRTATAVGREALTGMLIVRRADLRERT